MALPPMAVELLRKCRAKQAEAWFLLGKRLGAEDLVFARLDGRPLDLHELSKAFAYLARKAKLPGVTLHALRHAHASLLLKAGVEVRVVAVRLGHSSAAFTLATYGHTLAGPRGGRQARRRAARRREVGGPDHDADDRNLFERASPVDLAWLLQQVAERLRA